MSETEARRLLAAVTKRAADLEAAKADRTAAILAAMDAGIPRQLIAVAARLDRSRLRQIRLESLNDPNQER